MLVDALRAARWTAAHWISFVRGLLKRSARPVNSDPREKVMSAEETKRRTELAYFCLSRARKALRDANSLRISGDTIPDAAMSEGSSLTEDFAVALQHVYQSCKFLNGGWPSWSTKGVRAAANDFMNAWQGAHGTDLRDAYSHYEEAIFSPEHRRRNDTIDESVVWHKLEYPRNEETGELALVPSTVTLLGRDYHLEGIYEPLERVEREFREALVPLAAEVTSADTNPEFRWPLRLLVHDDAQNLVLVQDHSHLGGGIDQERWEAMHAARATAEHEKADG